MNIHFSLHDNFIKSIYISQTAEQERKADVVGTALQLQFTLHF